MTAREKFICFFYDNQPSSQLLRCFNVVYKVLGVRLNRVGKQNDNKKKRVFRRRRV